MVWFVVRAGGFSPFQSIQPYSGAYAAFLSMGKVVRAWISPLTAI